MSSNQTIYFKTQFPFDKIKTLIEENQYTTINVYIDIASVNKTYFSAETIKKEFIDQNQNHYFVNDLKSYIKNINSELKEFDPKFVIFFDESGSIQNKEINESYKAQRIDGFKAFIRDGKITEDEYQYYKTLKKVNNSLIEKHFNIPNKVFVVNFNNYEGDLVAHYCIVKNILGSSNSKTLNIIISNDKDLLQSCRYKNTIQLLYSYSSKTKQGYTRIYDYYNACQQLLKDQSRKLLTADYIPALLAIGGDVSDNIKNVPKVAHKTAYDIILETGIPPILKTDSDISKAERLIPYTKLILDNFKMTSFDEQIERLPPEIISKFDIFTVNESKDNNV